jgi:hypothetical protein
LKLTPERATVKIDRDEYRRGQFHLDLASQLCLYLDDERVR